MSNIPEIITIYTTKYCCNNNIIEMREQKGKTIVLTNKENHNITSLEKKL